MANLVLNYLNEFEKIIETEFKTEKRPTIKPFSAKAYDKKLNLVIEEKMNSNFFANKEFMNFYSEFRKYYYFSLGGLIRSDENKIDPYLFWVEIKNALTNAKINTEYQWR